MLFSMNDKEGGKGKHPEPAPLDNYLQMDEKQKDAETQKAVLRLQKRIQEILYLLDVDKSPASLLDKERKDKP